MPKITINTTTLMNLLVSTAPNKLFVSIVLGILSGLAYALLIPMVLTSISSLSGDFTASNDDHTYFIFGYEISTPKFALAFIITCIFIFLSRTLSLLMLERIAINSTLNLRSSLYRRITRLPIEDLERIGAAKLLTLITTDVPRLIMGASALPQIIISVATVIGLLGFLIYLNVGVFLFTLAGILCGLITYRLPLYLGEKYLFKARICFESIQQGIEGLLNGAKELKLNRNKTDSFLQKALYERENDYQRNQWRARTLIIIATSYGELVCFFVIGMVVFVVANAYDISLTVLSGVVMAMLYITTPITIILNSLNPVILASASLKRFNRLACEMPIEIQTDQASVNTIRNITLYDIQYQYLLQNEETSRFLIGPLDLTFRSGEISYIVGGNGSGKSTLGKIISLHYIPSGGRMLFNDTLIKPENRDSYRQTICAIYTDFYVFSELLGFGETDFDLKAERYLNELRLERKVRIDNGAFSTTSLSDGERKRLALLVAYLENRDIYIFDEWAADQDPEFKDIFYRHILPSLKERGKIVIVITHDDRYFELADNIFYMENGKLIK